MSSEPIGWHVPELVKGVVDFGCGELSLHGLGMGRGEIRIRISKSETNSKV